MKFEFCLPTRSTAVPSGPNWFHEIKADGYRLRVERDGDRVRLIRHELYRSAASMKSGFPMAGRRGSFTGTISPGRRLRSDLADSAVAERVAKIFARAGQRMWTRQIAVTQLRRD
jgi:hypothetical protein